MKLRTIKSSLWLLLVLCTYNQLMAADLKTDRDVWLYLNRQSDFWFEQHSSSRSIDPGEWKKPLEMVFSKLSRYSGETNYKPIYRVVDDSSFNAACYPNGKIVVNSGTLEFMDEQLEREIEAPLSSLPQEKRDELRAVMIAPVIAHELGHYINRHSYKYFLRLWKAQGGSAGGDFDYSMMKFSQKNEFEADMTGYYLLQKAGYPAERMIGVLSMMNVFHQKSLSAGGGSSLASYFSTHPSPHKRVAALNAEGTEFHKMAAKLEQAFEYIQLGKDLQVAIDILDSALKQYPENIFLRKANTIAYHKLWLATVPVREQKMKGIITTAGFRDDMVLKKEAERRSTKKTIPGDKKIYYKAKQLYLKTWQEAADHSFNSNFALLLAYSPKKNETEFAKSLAHSASRESGHPDFISNEAMVLYLAGDKKKSEEILLMLAVQFDKEYSKLLSHAQMSPFAGETLKRMKKHISMVQSVDKTFVFSYFTPLLNLSMFYMLEWDMEKSKTLAYDYLTRYESRSTWARFLADIHQIEITQPEKKYFQVNGIKVTDGLKKVIDTWGKPDTTDMGPSAQELWTYDRLGAKLTIENGVVETIRLFSVKSPRIDNQFGIGSSRSSIEEILGRYKRFSDSYFVYDRQQEIAVQYVLGECSDIILLK